MHYKGTTNTGFFASFTILDDTLPKNIFLNVERPLVPVIIKSISLLFTYSRIIEAGSPSSSIPSELTPLFLALFVASSISFLAFLL